MSLLLGLAMGVSFTYCVMRAHYHLGCAKFMNRCAELILQDRFNPDTVLTTFREQMPWHKKEVSP